MSWRSKCEITSQDWDPLSFPVARKEAIFDRELLFSLCALRWCPMSCWGRGRCRCWVPDAFLNDGGASEERSGGADEEGRRRSMGGK
jgi:hypothetical protein